MNKSHPTHTTERVVAFLLLIASVLGVLHTLVSMLFRAQEVPTIEEQSYNEGFFAHMKGVERWMNPYPQVSTGRDWWFKGWDEFESPSERR